jgi:hypothetical protein
MGNPANGYLKRCRFYEHLPQKKSRPVDSGRPFFESEKRQDWVSKSKFKRGMLLQDKQFPHGGVLPVGNPKIVQAVGKRIPAGAVQVQGY